MTDYLDIRATRIQRWLGRTTELRNRAGASNLLCRITSEAVVTPQLPAYAEWNAEAGDVDGVISIKFTPQPGQDPATAAAELSRTLVTTLQEVAPSLGFEAAWVRADSYGDAYALLAAKAGAGDYAYDAPGLNTELVMAARCPECAQRPARPRGSEVEPIEGATTARCAECQAKRAEARRREDVREGAADRELRRVRQAEAVRTRRDLKRAFGLEIEFPKDFESLARSVDRKGTHLALIFADGNRIGAFMGAAAAAHAGEKTELAKALQKATTSAVVAAVEDGQAGMWPAIPHLVGGDDLLISVPAEFGWRVATRFAGTFSAAIQEARQTGWPTELPTASIGLLFHHYSEPFPLALERCEALLSHAKKRFSGSEAAVAFTDLTFDGEDVREQRTETKDVFTVGWLTANQPTIDVCAQTLAAAQRYSLYDLTRPRQPDDKEPPGPAPDLGRKLISLDNRALLRLLGAAGLQPAALKGTMTNADADLVRRVLALLRWWR